MAGRPSSFDPVFVEQVKKLCLLGATDIEIADFFDVSDRTIHRWKYDHPEFCQSLTAGKELANNRVVRSLYQRAVGYTVQTEKLMTVALGNGQGSEVQTHKLKEHVPAEFAAGKFWLLNRDRENWRDKTDVNHTGELTVVSKEQRDASLAAAVRADS